MRKLILPSALALAGCGAFDPPEVTDCERHIISKLRSPSTYKRIDASGIGIPFDKPLKYSVTIEYDAANAYGTPVRERQLCVFAVKNGRPDTSLYYDFDHDFEGRGKTGDQISEEANAALSAAINASSD